jgi:hypothetical protein
MDAFNVSLRGVCHEAFARGVMASPAGVRVGDCLRISCEVVEKMPRCNPSTVRLHGHVGCLHGV